MNKFGDIYILGHSEGSGLGMVTITQYL